MEITYVFPEPWNDCDGAAVTQLNVLMESSVSGEDSVGKPCQDTPLSIEGLLAGDYFFTVETQHGDYEVFWISEPYALTLTDVDHEQFEVTLACQENGVDDGCGGAR